jgi:hypothetical protein
MQTVTLEITNDNAIKVLQELQDKHFINIVAKSDLSSPVFPGKPLTSEEFKAWAANRENGPAMTLKEARIKWARKKNQLLKLVK